MYTRAVDAVDERFEMPSFEGFQLPPYHSGAFLRSFPARCVIK